MLHLQQDIRDINRLRQILLVLVEEGLGHYLIRAKWGPHLPFRHRLSQKPLSSPEEAAVHICHACARLGPSFIKLGQLLSLRPDLVTLEVSKQLECLQDNVAPLPFSQIEQTLEEELGKPWKKVFSSLEKKPLASASVAQVHRARLRSGKEVVVKVQRPGISRMMETDIDILLHLAKSLERHIPATRNFRPVHIVQEFTHWSKRELDFGQEAENALQLRAEMADNPNVFVPPVIRELCTRRLMVQEFVDGVKINDFAFLKKQKINRRRLAMNYFESLLEQALLHGFFHADPHPANILVNRKGRLVFLDYGIMGYLTLDDRAKVIRFIRSLEEKDAQKSMGLILALARDTSLANVEGWKQEALPLLERVARHSLQEQSIGKALYQLIALGAKHHIIFDPNHILIAKIIYQAEGIGLQLDPQFKVREGFAQFAAGALRKEANPLRMLEKTAQKLWYQKDLLWEMPERLRLLLTPETHPSVPLAQLQELEREWEQESRRKNWLLLTSLFFLAGIFLMYVEGRTFLGGISLSTSLLIAASFFFFLFWKTQRGGAHGETG